VAATHDKRLADRRWTLEVAGFSCDVERVDDVWVVTLAGATIGRSENLDSAIVLASGGVVSPSEARQIALSLLQED
jgi:hypothetical protein